MMFETFQEQDCSQSWFDIGLRLRRSSCCSFTLITLLLVIVVFVASCTLMQAGCDLHIYDPHGCDGDIASVFFALSVIKMSL